jgi:hypothetical protein
MRVRRIWTVAVVLAAIVASPAAASAADLYASPTGTSNPTCGQAAPCDILTAVNNATQGDTVIVEPGTYTASVSLDDTGAGGPITIEGEPGAPTPVIDSSAQYAVEIFEGSTVRDLDVADQQNDAWGIYVSDTTATVDHVYVQVGGSGSGACYPYGTLADSVCWANGGNGIGMTLLVSDVASATLRNDTIIASGAGGEAVKVDPQFSSQTMTVNLTNTIARGTAADLYVGAISGATATVTADHSNFATVDNAGGGGTITAPAPASGTNQTGAPAFVLAGAGDFHELVTSPTVGAGVDSTLNGSVDLDGNPRELDGKTDIGAYEYVPPPACSPAKVLTHYGKRVSVALHCTDVTGAALTYSVATKPAHGTVSAPAAGGTLVYTPNHGYSGSDHFTYHATSAHGTSAVATVTVVVGPAAPVISDVRLHEGTLRFKLSAGGTVTLTFSEHGHVKRTVHLMGKHGENSYKVKKLGAGKYTITIAAANGGGHAKKKTLSLKIKR